MNLFFLRHGIAVARGTAGFPNDDRPLTDEGIGRLKKEAKGILRCVEPPDVILTSPLRRALETAKIVAAEYHSPGLVKITNALLPASGLKEVLDELVKYKGKESVILVGHSPDLESVAGTLLGAPARLLELKKGGMCRIELDAIPAKRPGRLHWLLTPKQLRALS